MSIAGGCSTIIISRIRKMHLHPLIKAMLCGVGISGIEYVCGLLWNKHYTIWDYRNQPCNLHGQICLSYSLLWCLLSFVVMKTMNAIEQ